MRGWIAKSVLFLALSLLYTCSFASTLSTTLNNHHNSLDHSRLGRTLHARVKFRDEGVNEARDGDASIHADDDIVLDDDNDGGGQQDDAQDTTYADGDGGDFDGNQEEAEGKGEEGGTQEEEDQLDGGGTEEETQSDDGDDYWGDEPKHDPPSPKNEEEDVDEEQIEEGEGEEDSFGDEPKHDPPSPRKVERKTGKGNNDNVAAVGAVTGAGINAAKRKPTTPPTKKPTPKPRRRSPPPPPPANPFHLASFEGGPAPPPLSFRAWQAHYQAQRKAAAKKHAYQTHGEAPPDQTIHPSVSSPTAYEFSSREELAFRKTVGGPAAREAGDDMYLAMCVVARDAHDDLVEWVHHHFKLGFSKIYLYDDNSDPPLARVVKPWIESGRIEYTLFSEFTHPSNKPQLYGYDRCLQEHAQKHSFMAFFDIDEYLMFQQGPPIQHLPTFLKKFEQYSALAVHWRLFGSYGREYRPDRGTLRSYPRCLPTNHTQHLFVKTIANTKCTAATTDTPHSFRHNCSRPAVRTNFAPVSGQSADDLPVHDVLALHHYATRSAEEFEIKMARGSGMKRQRGWEYFVYMENWSTEFCLEGLQVWDDNVVSLPRTLDPGTVQEQLDIYAKEDHDDVFWKGGGGVLPATQTKIAKKVQEAEQAEADQWGKVDTNVEEEEEAEEERLVGEGNGETDLTL